MGIVSKVCLVPAFPSATGCDQRPTEIVEGASKAVGDRTNDPTLEKASDSSGRTAILFASSPLWAGGSIALRASVQEVLASVPQTMSNTQMRVIRAAAAGNILSNDVCRYRDREQQFSTTN